MSAILSKTFLFTLIITDSMATKVSKPIPIDAMAFCHLDDCHDVKLCIASEDDTFTSMFHGVNLTLDMVRVKESSTGLRFSNDERCNYELSRPNSSRTSLSVCNSRVSGLLELNGTVMAITNNDVTSKHFLYLQKNKTNSPVDDLMSQTAKVMTTNNISKQDEIIANQKVLAKVILLTGLQDLDCDPNTDMFEVTKDIVVIARDCLKEYASRHSRDKVIEIVLYVLMAILLVGCMLCCGLLCCAAMKSASVERQAAIDDARARLNENMIRNVDVD